VAISRPIPRHADHRRPRRLVEQPDCGRDGRPGLPEQAVFTSDAGHVSILDAGRATLEIVAAPTRTPWNSLNARLNAPADLQLTIFQELAGAD
jgi:hypothetical protein